MTGFKGRSSLSGPLFAAGLSPARGGGLQKAGYPPETAMRVAMQAQNEARGGGPGGRGFGSSFLLPRSTGPPGPTNLRSRSGPPHSMQPQARAAAGTGGAFYPGSPSRRMPDREMVSLNRTGGDAFVAGPGKWGALPPVPVAGADQGFLSVLTTKNKVGPSAKGVPPVRMGPLGLRESSSTPALNTAQHGGSRPWSGGSGGGVARDASLVGLAAAERRLYSTAETSTGIKLQMRHMVKDLSNMQDRNASARRHIGTIKEVEALEKEVEELKTSVGSMIVSARSEIFEYFARVQSDLDFLEEDVGKMEAEHDAMQNVLGKMDSRVKEFEKIIGHS